ncbi:hypothetical protein Thein_0320 [Thermodesulfatator indicus DSM 15286]|uniref:Uncharacterized protein n=1 Tax=Thermodesulfatator indicus (strain DSM 15286 / JCM 11887 / CIR29812) TaxID=667014 RepID=F8AA68_THEID|nr:universal stress protein [Thermodesulfatator indicus]AEH44204.1 hypothetical protein Thein_0320 [Thermodesulfatator indicus DSM 15286]
MAKFSNILRQFIDSFVVKTFAEAGEFDIAQKWAREWNLGFSEKLPFWHRIFAASAFAEAGEFEEALRWLAVSPTSDVKIKTRAVENLLEQSIEVATAATFAEASEFYKAVKIIARLRGKKVLVVCEGANFPERLMRQAFDMAKNMNTELIVLNIFMQTMHAKDSEHTQKWRDKFRLRAKEGLEFWKEKYPEVQVAQVVKFGEPIQVLEEFLMQNKGIKYIFTLKEVSAKHALEARPFWVKSFKH